MLDLALLRRPGFSGLLGGALLYQAAAFSGLVYLSLWLQNVLGLSPIRGGLALMPLAGTVLRGRRGRRAAHAPRSPRACRSAAACFIIGRAARLLRR